MVELWNHHPLRVVAFALPALFALGRGAQLFLQYRKIKRDGLRGNFVAQVIVGLLFALFAAVLCWPQIAKLTPRDVGLTSPEDDMDAATIAAVTSARAKASLLPPEVRFKGPLVPARDAILKSNWAALAGIVFDVRTTSNEFERDTDFLLRRYADQLGKQYLVFGRAALERGDTALARKYLDYATDLAPDEADGFLLRAQTAPADDWRLAIKDLDLAIRRTKPGDPRQVEATEKRLAVRLAHNDTRGALEDVDVLLSFHPDDVARLAQRGQLRLTAGAVDGAIADLASACAALPNDLGLKLELAGARLRKDDVPEQLKLALADLNRVIAGKQDTFRARYLRGQVHFALNHLPEATADLSKALQLDPKNADAHFLRGRVHLALDQLIAAKKEMNDALALNPDHRAALFWRGFLTKDRDPKSALADFGRAYDLEPDAWSLFYKGECLLVLGHKDEAEAAYGDALTQAKDPKLIEIINKALTRAHAQRRH